MPQQTMKGDVTPGLAARDLEDRGGFLPHMGQRMVIAGLRQFTPLFGVQLDAQWSCHFSLRLKVYHTSIIRLNC